MGRLLAGESFFLSPCLIKKYLEESPHDHEAGTATAAHEDEDSEQGADDHPDSAHETPFALHLPVVEDHPVRTGTLAHYPGDVTPEPESLEKNAESLQIGYTMTDTSLSYTGLEVQLVVLAVEVPVDPVAVVGVPAHEPVNFPPPVPVVESVSLVPVTIAAAVA